MIIAQLDDPRPQQPLDIFSALVTMVPLILPVAVIYGVDPLHLGVIFLANMHIGYFTPPVGMNLFIASYRLEIPWRNSTGPPSPSWWCCWPPCL